MPSDIKEGDYEYRDMMDQLNEVIQKYEETYDILLCGDMRVWSEVFIASNGMIETLGCRFKVFPLNRI
jgi:predicted RNase H-related nuclease YkuK (DUF458 family)